MSQDPMAPDGLDIGIDSRIFDAPGNVVQFRVEAADDPDTLEMRLEVEPYMKWWKSLSYFMMLGPLNLEWRRIETKDDKKEAEQILFGWEIIQFGRFDLWKGGFMGFGAYLTSVSVNTWANRGRRLVFHWIDDGEPQQ